MNMDIFTLTTENGQLFHPVRQAATFAKYSRSPESARELVMTTDELSGAKFQQKWIVKFGHNAIAELATIPVAFEGVSIVASKAIEAWQRPGVCEKSTRMVYWDPSSLFVPDGIDPKVLDAVMPLVDQCFKLYKDLLEGDLKSSLAAENPELNDFQVGRMAFDMARYLLPAGCRTNLGICAYPRDISSMVAEFSGSLNPEFRDIGGNLKVATEGLGGPLIRHTKPDEWVNRIPVPVARMNSLVQKGQNSVTLTGSNMTETAFWKRLRDRYGMKPQDLDALMQDRPEYKDKASHEVPKLFRDVQLDFSIYMDYGAFRDLQRHRRMEQFVEYLTPIYGFAIPPGMVDIANKHYRDFRSLLERFEAVPWPTDPVQRMLCQYLTPLAFLVGWHVKMDLQQLYYLVELRTQEAGHPSYRGVSYDLWDETTEEFPILTQWMRPRGPRPTS
jgi:thymidylate synthase ThyX